MPSVSATLPRGNWVAGASGGVGKGGQNQCGLEKDLDVEARPEGRGVGGGRG